MTMVPGPATPEVVLASSVRALALMAEHALAWRRGHCLPVQVMIGAACPGCGGQVAAVLARGQTAREALAALRAAGRCLHPDASPDGTAPPSGR